MTRGIAREIVIDGRSLAFGPDSIEIAPQRAVTAVEMKSDTHLFADYHLPGLPDVEERWQVRLPFSGLEDAEEYDFLDGLRLASGFHFLALWVPTVAIYTLVEGQATLYLPRRRRDAATVHGVESERRAVATLDGVAMTVGYDDAVLPAEPGAGTLTISRTPVTLGLYRDYTAMRVAAALGGETLRLTWYPELRVYVHEPRMSHPGGLVEHHELTLVER